MKKFSIIISPLFAVLLVPMCISHGLKGALITFGMMLFSIVFTVGLAKWIDFVDKHVKD